MDDNQVAISWTVTLALNDFGMACKTTERSALPKSKGFGGRTPIGMRIAFRINERFTPETA